MPQHTSGMRTIEIYNGIEELRRRRDENRHKEEEHKLAIEEANIKLKQLKLDQKKQQLGIMSGQPAKEISVGPAPLMPMQSPEQQASGMPAPQPITPTTTTDITGTSRIGRVAEAPMPGVTVGPDEGIDQPQFVRATSMQELLRQRKLAEQAKQAEEVFKSNLKRNENAVDVPPIPGLGIDKPTTVDKSIAPSLVSAAGAATRQTSQQTATAEENRKNREAAAATAEANRKARIEAAQVTADARLKAAQRGGVNQKIITRADAKVREFLASPTVKKYAEASELLDYAKNFPLQAATAEDDYALIVSLAKAVDPNSVAREGEVATAQKYAQSWKDNYGIDVESILNRSRALTVAARQNVIGAIRAKLAPNEKQYQNLRGFYKKQIGSMQGLDDAFAEDLIPNLGNIGTGGGTVKMKAPTGEVTDVPADQVQHYKGLGAVEVK